MKKIEIVTKKEIFKPGDEVQGKLILRNTKELEVKKISLEVIGREYSTIQISEGMLSNTYHCSNYLLLIKKRMEKEVVLNPGDHEYPFSFMIPKEALPTYEGQNTKTQYILRVKVHLDAFFNLKTRKVIYVTWDPKEKVRKEKKVKQKYRSITTKTINLKKSEKGSWERKKPELLVELDKKRLIAGEELTGRLKVHNLEGKKVENIKVTLKGKEYSKAQGYKKYLTVQRHKFEIKLDNISEKHSKEFNIQLPEELDSSFKGRISRLDWFLVFKINIGWNLRVKVSCPIKVFKLTTKIEEPEFIPTLLGL